MNQYRAVTPAAVGMFEDGIFERDFTPTEEQDWCFNRGLLEIVPRPYRVLSDNYTIEGWPCPQGAIVTAAFPIEIEAALIAGGHLERARRDAQPTTGVSGDEAEPETPPDNPQPRRRRTSTPVKE